jgi:hypothetical protein
MYALRLLVVPRPRHRQGTMLALNQGDNGNNGNGDGGLPGEFDGDEPDDLLIHVERSKDSVPATYRTSRVSPGNPQVELERAATGTSVATSRNTEEVRLSFFRMTPQADRDSIDVRWGSGSESSH